MLRNVLVNGMHLVEPGDLGAGVVGPRTRSIKRCEECEEDRPDAGGARMCAICGAPLVSVVRPVAAEADEGAQLIAAAALRSEMNEMLDLLGVGDEFRAALLQQNSERVRPINKDFVSTLGKVKVNARGTILYDVYVSVGGLQILAVPASFSWLPPDDRLPFVLDGAPLALAEPAMLEASLSASAYVGSALLGRRGICSFAAKAKRAAAARCSVLLCIQTHGSVFPFEMGDAAGELTADDELALAGLLVLMVPSGQGDLLERMCRPSSATSRDTGRVRASVRVVKRDRECSICQEEFCGDQSVLKLPCRHAYHEGCLMRWLEGHTTCPVCRTDFPAEQAGTTPGGADQQQEQDRGSAFFDAMT